MKRVLILDDDVAILESLAMALEFDYEVVTASTADEAFRQATSSAFDVIVLDLMMPGLDGVAVKRHLDELGVNVPVILITASQHGETKAAEARVAGHLSKPFKIDTIEREIERVTARWRPEA